jgi:RNA polymerase sigma factor (sigma-70 family)
MVFGVCRRALADPADVEDAFQATFLVLVRRAGSVRVGESLGRWLYGVSRRVAAKARARSQRTRIRMLPLTIEPTAADSPPDQSGLLAALDDEVSRLPEKYRVPIILCHLEGLSHAEAATRLRWPVGTVSGRLSRARGLLKDRLVRRGLASTSGSIVALLANDQVRAAVPAPFTVTTTRVAAALACGAESTAGAAAALTLMNEVLRSLVAFKLKVAAAALFTLATLVAAAAHFGGGTIAPLQRATSVAVGERVTGPISGPVRPSAHRPADEIVKEIDELLQPPRRPVAQAEFIQTRHQIAGLVDELRTAYPTEPRLARYLPERWECLTDFRRRTEILAEISAAHRTAQDPALKKEALLFEAGLRFLEPIDGRTAASLAQAFAEQTPHDKRGGELLQAATAKLDDDCYLRVGLVASLLLAGVLIWCTTKARSAMTRPRLKLAAVLGVMVVALLVCVLCTVQFLPDGRQTAIYGFFFEKLSALRDPFFVRRASFVAFTLLHKIPEQVGTIVRSVQAVLAVALASATAVSIVIAQRRLVRTPKPWTATIRLAALGFIACLAGVIAVDTLLITSLRSALAHRLTMEYPGSIAQRLDNGQRMQESWEAQLVEGQRRQREDQGKPFNIEFADAITGRPVSMTALRGKVVVIDFWATDRGPLWSAELSKLKRLYDEYHPKGVEFIGVSLDRRAEDGGLAALKTFVAREQVPWPQYHEGSDLERSANRRAPADRLLESVLAYEGFESRVAPHTSASEFALSWGIGFLADFLIDADGKLYSTEARGKLDTLIPRVLEQNSSTGR